MNSVVVERVGLEAETIIQKVFEQSPAYFKKVEGSEVLPHFAKKALTDEPTTKKVFYEHVFCLLKQQGEVIGVVDLHKNHPEKGIVYLGLLLLPESKRARGQGRKCFAAVETFIRHTLKGQKIRLGISEDNDVEGFWLKMGFKPNGRTYKWKGEAHVTNVFEMDKDL